MTSSQRMACCIAPSSTGTSAVTKPLKTTSPQHLACYARGTVIGAEMSCHNYVVLHHDTLAAANLPACDTISSDTNTDIVHMHTALLQVRHTRKAPLQAHRHAMHTGCLIQVHKAPHELTAHPPDDDDGGLRCRGSVVGSSIQTSPETMEHAALLRFKICVKHSSTTPDKHDATSSRKDSHRRCADASLTFHAAQRLSHLCLANTQLPNQAALHAGITQAAAAVSITS
ncbi:hypothetical protein COO60DRAFT_485207 [Scenedesmus sp. NREL 46B-D3]|nr:hypothetical protein COO60DRAFT_485207 [Scenedesmus sp. NREL 46B-D3]